MPTFNLFGWQKPCYLLQDGYADTFEELMQATEWEKYGTESGNPKCANCMVHSGYEASAVHDTFGSLSGFWGTVKATFSTGYKDDEAAEMLKEPVRPVHAHNPLVQIGDPPFRQAGERSTQQLRRRGHERAAATISRWTNWKWSKEHEHHKIEGWVPDLASDAELRAGARVGVRLSRRCDDHAQGRHARGRLHLRPAQRRDAGRVGGAGDSAKIRTRRSVFRSLILPPWHSADATWLPARVGKPGSRSTGRRKPPARRDSPLRAGIAGVARALQHDPFCRCAAGVGPILEVLRRRSGDGPSRRHAGKRCFPVRWLSSEPTVLAVLKAPAR